MQKQFYRGLYDAAIKEVFMKEENKDLLTFLLENILDLKIKEIKYLNLERNVLNIHVKRKHFDKLAKEYNNVLEIAKNYTEHNPVAP